MGASKSPADNSEIPINTAAFSPEVEANGRSYRPAADQIPGLVIRPVLRFQE